MSISELVQRVQKTMTQLVAMGFDAVPITDRRTDYVKRYLPDDLTPTEMQNIRREARDAIQVYVLRSPAVKHVTVVAEFQI